MLECLLIEANAEDDDRLDAKLPLMEQFLAADPEGAGGPARDYWTGWGVNPGPA